MNQTNNPALLPLTGRWEKILGAYLEENHSQMFNELLASGELVQFIEQRVETFCDHMRDLRKQGRTPDQAMELAWEEFIAVPGTPERS